MQKRWDRFLPCFPSAEPRCSQPVLASPLKPYPALEVSSTRPTSGQPTPLVMAGAHLVHQLADLHQAAQYQDYSNHKWSQWTHVNEKESNTVRVSEFLKFFWPPSVALRKPSSPFPCLTINAGTWNINGSWRYQNDNPDKTKSVKDPPCPRQVASRACERSRSQHASSHRRTFLGPTVCVTW